MLDRPVETTWVRYGQLLLSSNELHGMQDSKMTEIQGKEEWQKNKDEEERRPMKKGRQEETEGNK
jgi:hypothetical protein